MKKVSKILSFLLALSFLFLLAACGNDNKEKGEDHSIYEHGLDLISLMEEMAESETYFQLYSVSEELRGIASEVENGNYRRPKKVYQIQVSEEAISLMADGASLDELPRDLKEYLSSRMYASLAQRINGAGGTNMLAAASIYTAGKTFVNTAFTGNAIYLYVYKDAPSVMVTFIAGDDGAVSASGSFIFNENFKTESAETIELFFDGISVEVQEIEK